VSVVRHNVLRILRGAPEGLTCGEIANRMLTRVTPEGLAVLARLDRPVQEAHRKQLGRLGWERLRALSELLSACRRRVV
jgi:hypothetical protein